MSDRAQSDNSELVIVVVRTGGVGGIRRRWQIEPPHAESAQWIALIDDCPWDEPSEADRGADRYVWSIRARTPEAQRERELPESSLDGPWRLLVSAVRDAATADADSNTDANTRRGSGPQISPA